MPQDVSARRRRWIALRTWHSWSAGAFLNAGFEPPWEYISRAERGSRSGIRGDEQEASLRLLGGELTLSSHLLPDSRFRALLHMSSVWTRLAVRARRVSADPAARLGSTPRHSCSRSPHRRELCPPYAPFLGFAGVACAVSPPLRGAALSRVPQRRRATDKLGQEPTLLLGTGAGR